MASGVLSASDAERMAEEIRCFGVRDVGSKEWFSQHTALTKLNLQAHVSAQAQSEDFVLEAMVAFDKMGALVHELLVAEAWRNFLYPKIKEIVAQNAPIRGYYILYHEAVICNLLEVLLYHDYAAEACGDAVVELVDYCCRKVTWLLSQPAEARANFGVPTTDDASDPLKELSRKGNDMQFRSSICAVSILRYLCEHCPKLPLGIMTRILNTHDVLCLIVPLIEDPPWAKRSGEGVWSKFDGQKWNEIKREDLLKLTSVEAQPWLILFYLTCEAECRKRYELSSFRKDTILRARKYMNEILLDQLPVLADVQRYLDQLVIMEVPPAAKSSAFILETVPEVRDGLVSTNWHEEQQFATSKRFATKESANDALIQELAGIYSNDSVESLLSGMSVAESDVPKPISFTLTSRRTESKDSSIYARWELIPRTDAGTKQNTSKGTFERLCLVLADEENGTTVSKKEKRIPATGYLLLEVFFSNGEVKEVAAEVSATNVLEPGTNEAAPASAWKTLGSLADYAVAQVQLVAAKDLSPADNEKTLALGDVYYSYSPFLF